MNKMDLGATLTNLHSYDFYRTAVYDSQILIYSLFEEYSDQGQMFSDT